MAKPLNAGCMGADKYVKKFFSANGVAAYEERRGVIEAKYTQECARAREGERKAAEAYRAATLVAMADVIAGLGAEAVRPPQEL